MVPSDVGNSAPANSVTGEDLPDGASVDSESIAQLVHGGASSVRLDELLGLLVVELAGSADAAPLRRRSGRCGRVRQLPEQRFQRPDLVLCVVVSSPKVHPTEASVPVWVC